MSLVFGVVLLVCFASLDLMCLASRVTAIVFDALYLIFVSSITAVLCSRFAFVLLAFGFCLFFFCGISLGQDIILGRFEGGNEETKTAAAYAVGNIAVGNMDL